MLKKKLYRTTFRQNQILYYQVDDKMMGLNISQTGQYDEYECRLILRQLRKGDIALDVGANIGCYTLIMAKAVGPSGHVYSFEPDPTNFQVLLKNIRANGLKNVTALNMAVSEEQKDQQLFLSTKNCGDHRLYEDKNEKRKRKSVPVKSNSLDNLIFTQLKLDRKIKLIKIDTQGYEPFIIRGARQLISTQRPVLFFEYWTYGYRILGVDFYQMIHFLKRIYGEVFFIDQKYGVYYLVDQDFIDRYCEQMDGKMHCDLMCGAMLQKPFFHNTVKKLIPFISNNRFKKTLKIDFGVRGNSFLYRKKGWSYPEGDFTWTNDRRASLRIDLKKIGSGLSISFMVFPFLVPGKKDNQKLILDINGHRIKSWVLVAPGDQNLNCDIPRKLLNQSGLRLTFETPDAVSPKAMRVNGDNRSLAVAFKNVVITRER